MAKDKKIRLARRARITGRTRWEILRLRGVDQTEDVLTTFGTEEGKVWSKTKKRVIMSGPKRPILKLSLLEGTDDQRPRGIPNKPIRLTTMEDILQAESTRFDLNTKREAGILGHGRRGQYWHKKRPWGKPLFGPHARMEEAGVPKGSIESGKFQVTPISKEHLYRELLQKYPSAARNKAELAKIARQGKSKRGPIKSGFGLRGKRALDVAIIDERKLEHPTKLTYPGDIITGKAFFGPQRKGGDAGLLRLNINAATQGLQELEGWIQNILDTVPKTEYQVALIAEAFRPTYVKILRYTPFDPYQKTQRVHILETASFEYGVKSSKPFMRVLFGGRRAPHTQYVYHAPESHNFQGEGKPRWIEKAIRENEQQFYALIQEFLFGNLITGLGPSGHGGISPASLDEMMRYSLTMDMAAAADSPEVFERQRHGGGRLSSSLSMDEFSQALSEYYVPSGYDYDGSPDSLANRNVISDDYSNYNE